MGLDLDAVVWDEIEAMNVGGDLLIGGDYPGCLLYGAPQTMVTEMALEPVVTMIPVSKIAQVAYFDHPGAVLVPVLFHSMFISDCEFN